LRIAERLASEWRARALVTGEAIGQVASQTLDNMVIIAQATNFEVLRPLVGFDKDEITNEAARIGTLPISIIPDEDCCTLFTPKHPATRARTEEVALSEGLLPIDEMVETAVRSVSIEECRGHRPQPDAAISGPSK
jgi:thiamine biosynthesis protein ThiI